MAHSIILDSDFVYALFVENDSNHQKSIDKLEDINGLDIILTNLVKYELLTLFSRRQDQKTAIQFLNQIDNIGINYFFINKDLDQIIIDTFCSFKKKNISIVDCSNLILAQKFDYKIASFDAFYPKELLI